MWRGRDRGPAWKTALPTRDVKRWPTLGRGSPLPGIQTARSFTSRRKTDGEVRDSRDTDSTTKRIRRSPSSSSRSEARSSDIAEVCSSRRRLSKLFIVDITFYSRRAAAARRPDGASAVTRDGGCGGKRKKKKNGRTGHELCMSEFVRLRECETRRAYE